MSNLALEDLIELVKKGNDQAFQELYERFYKKTYYAALKITKNQADAKDITQETFIQVHKSISSLNDNSLFVQWLNRIIVSKASDLFRKNKTTTLPEDHALFQVQQEERFAFIPEANMHFTSDHELLDYFMSKIDERYRTVLVLHYFSELSIAEIAEALDIPEGTVKTRLKRGRDVLKDLISSYQDKEGVSLDFKSAEIATVLSGWFLYDFANTDITIPVFTEVSVKKVKKHSWNVFSMTACALLSAVIIYCGTKIFELSNISNDASTTYEVEEKAKFGPVKYQGTSYTNPEDAYYTLTLFAHCEVEMKAKSKAELAAIQPLYEELKRYRGVYWSMLQYRDWDSEFEAVLKQ